MREIANREANSSELTLTEKSSKTENDKAVFPESVPITFRQTFLLYFSMNYRDFSVKSKLIISLFQTVKLSLSISLFQ